MKYLYAFSLLFLCNVCYSIDLSKTFFKISFGITLEQMNQAFINRSDVLLLDSIGNSVNGNLKLRTKEYDPFTLRTDTKFSIASKCIVDKDTLGEVNFIFLNDKLYKIVIDASGKEEYAIKYFTSMFGKPKVWVEKLDEWKVTIRNWKDKNIDIKIKLEMPYFPGIVITDLTADRIVSKINPLINTSHNSIKIGSQLWMSEDLSVVTFRNGDTIKLAVSADVWAECDRKRIPAYCYTNQLQDSVNNVLYNGWAVVDKRGLAPIGWKIPSLKDLNYVVRTLGGWELAGGKMKDKSTWNMNQNDYQYNSKLDSKFNGKAKGSRGIFGDFISQGFLGSWWMSEDFNNSSYSVELLTFSMGYRNYDLKLSEELKGSGASVRCIKE
jgi:uncharacterized protein (TIGR02145 family)